MANNLERTERLEVERDYYRSLPAQQFRDLVEEEIPRIWREDLLVIEHGLQGNVELSLSQYFAARKFENKTK
jgi:hypothetical protein